MIAGLGWVDWALLAVLVVSVLVGLWRGFVFEVMSLLGWVVAWVAAQWFAVDLARHVPVGAPGSTLQLAVAFVLCFLAALIVWTLVARLVRMMLHATPLGLRLTKEALNHAIDAGGLEAAIAMEDRNQILASSDGDFQEGVQAFLEKRKPNYSKRDA